MPDLETRKSDYPQRIGEIVNPLPNKPIRFARARTIVPPEKKQRRFGASLAIAGSFLLHALLLLALFSRDLTRPPSGSSDPVEVTTEKALKDAAQNLEGEIVFTEKVESKPPPETTRFLSDRDQMVEKESRRPVIPAPEQARNQEEVVSEGLSMSDLGITPTAARSLSAEEQMESPVGGEVGENDSESLGWDWRLDSLENIPLGPRTLLNTKRYAHYAYYERMKRRLAPLWQSEVQRRMRALWISGRAPLEKKLSTTVAVGVDATGVVKFVELVKGSGIATVDDAAIEAFFEARSFPNPPQVLLNEAGELAMRWNFVVDVDGIRKDPLPEEITKRERDYR